MKITPESHNKLQLDLHDKQPNCKLIIMCGRSSFTIWHDNFAQHMLLCWKAELKEKSMFDSLLTQNSANIWF